MKTLELKQMEKVEGGDVNCAMAVGLLVVAAVGLFTMAAPVVYTAAIIANQSATVVGFVGGSAAMGMACS